MSDNSSVDNSVTVKTFMSNKTYDILKFIAQIFLPALATFYASFGSIWNFFYTEQIVGTIVALDLFLGALLSLSSLQYNKSDARFDGTMFVRKDMNVLGEDVLKVGYVFDTPAEVIENKNEVVLKVKEAPEDLISPS